MEGHHYGGPPFFLEQTCSTPRYKFLEAWGPKGTVIHFSAEPDWKKEFFRHLKEFPLRTTHAISFTGVNDALGKALFKTCHPNALCSWNVLPITRLAA